MAAPTRLAPVPIWPGEVPDNALWQDIGPELERPRWEDSLLVRNISVPTLTPILPDPAIANGTSVILCPGGAFHFLMVDKEGTLAAEWLNARGIAAFILKYRVHPTPDADEDFTPIAIDPRPYVSQMDAVRPMTMADGAQAVRLVRERADEWNVRPDRIGIMGFSAGGGPALGAATGDDPAGRPDFAAAIYAAWRGESVPADVPPLFIVTAADDLLVPSLLSLRLATQWLEAGRGVELHMYAKGGHGFALNQQQIPTDNWIERFHEWLAVEGLIPAAGA